MKQRGANIKKIIIILLPLAWMAMIFYLSHQPAEQSAELSGGIVANLIEIFHLPVTEHFVRKAAHFSEYAVLGILVVNAVRLFVSNHFLWTSVVVCSLYSVTDELHQLFIPGRSCQVSDMLLDTAGSAAGVLLWWLVICLMKKRKQVLRDKDEEGLH